MNSECLSIYYFKKIIMPKCLSQCQCQCQFCNDLYIVRPLPTRFPGSLLCKVSCKLLEDFGHLLLHKKANKVGRRVEFQRQWAGKATPPLLDGGLQGAAKGFHFVVCTLVSRETAGRTFQLSFGRTGNV